MSQLLISKYLNDLSDLRRVSGTRRETVVREAFKDLLKGWGKDERLLLPGTFALPLHISHSSS